MEGLTNKTNGNASHVAQLALFYRTPAFLREPVASGFCQGSLSLQLVDQTRKQLAGDAGDQAVSHRTRQCTQHLPERAHE